ncbi:MAG: site-specific DNA-methyltransferase [Bdellovibrionota bacterium]|nr:site-specific DNA-methyltransferase [Bdellovibrionota bacterium]
MNEKIKCEKLKMMTKNLTNEKYDALVSLFPNAITETIDEEGNVVRAIDADILEQEISQKVVKGQEERYQFTWPDKKKSVILANKPSTKTLKLDTKSSFGRNGEKGSIDTGNIYIEGDNLEALKLLHETYLGKIKMIYIDPPYNTGNDFVYKDNFTKSTDEYLKESDQFDEEGNRLVQNLESNGRFHTDWLNMMYPRLRLAKDLLTDDGVIFISIDDNEQENLKKICDEIFGASMFIANFKWNRVKKAPSLSGSVRTKYEYILSYYKKERFKLFGKASYNKQGPLWHLPNKNQVLIFPTKSIRVKQSFPKKYYGGTYKVELLDDLICENGFNKNEVRIAACSAWGQEKIYKYVKEGKTFEIKKDLTTVYTDLDSDNNFIAPSDIINQEECGVKCNTDANDELKNLGIPFDYSKPTGLIEYLVKMIPTNDKPMLVLDFFSGSATTAHAIMKLNSEDGQIRNYILVQLPEVSDNPSYKNICEIGKKRIQESGLKIKESHPLFDKNLDIGFRVFKVDESNMKDVYYLPEELKQAQLDFFESNIKDNATNEDLFIQVMLELGIPLSEKITKEEIDGKEILFVNDNFLIASFDTGLTENVITQIAKKTPEYAVFKDGSYASDVVFANFEQIFETYSPNTKRKII